MADKIKFSVSVPAYKAQFLKDCIDSVLAQTYNNFELIIVNDASPQDLDSIVASYSDKRIRYYKNEKGFGAEHLVGNWNKCLEYATGDYIICMGDDDMLMPYCLQEYVCLIEKYPGLGAYHGWPIKIDSTGNIVSISLPLPERENVYSLIYARLSLRTHFIGDYAYDVKLLRANGGFYDMPFAWGSDDMTAYIAAIHNGIAHTQVPVYKYRISDLTISRQAHYRVKFDAMCSQLDWIQKFVSKETESKDLKDNLFRMQIIKQLPDFYFYFVNWYMENDMTVSKKTDALKYWLKNKSRTKWSGAMIFKKFLKCCFISFELKLMRK